MSIHSPQGLLKHDVWDLVFNGSEPCAFSLSTPTQFGLKFCLGGNNGSSEGKRATVDTIRTKFKKSGFYGEVSHKVAELALDAGSPVVCPAFVSLILRKSIIPNEEKVITYFRNLTGVGIVEKVMVGKPKGIPTTDAKNPSCPIIEDRIVDASDLDDDDNFDLQAHFGCLIDLGE